MKEVAACAAIVFVGMIALGGLWKEINGVLLLASTGTIGYIVGYVYGKNRRRKPPIRWV